VLIERDLIGAMPSPPETMPIARLVYRDAVNPCPQARLSAEPMDCSKDTEKDLL